MLFDERYFRLIASQAASLLPGLVPAVADSALQSTNNIARRAGLNALKKLYQRVAELLLVVIYPDSNPRQHSNAIAQQH